MDRKELTSGQSINQQVSKPTSDNINHLDLLSVGHKMGGTPLR